MSEKISIEKRIKASSRIVQYFIAKKKRKSLDDEQLIRRVYNSAIDDVDHAIQVYIGKNPQHAMALKLLQKELYWMYLIEEDV